MALAPREHQAAFQLAQRQLTKHGRLTTRAHTHAPALQETVPCALAGNADSQLSLLNVLCMQDVVRRALAGVSSRLEDLGDAMDEQVGWGGRHAARAGRHRGCTQLHSLSRASCLPPPPHATQDFGAALKAERMLGARLAGSLFLTSCHTCLQRRCFSWQDFGALKAERSLGARLAALNATVAELRQQLRSGLDSARADVEDELEAQVRKSLLLR